MMIINEGASFGLDFPFLELISGFLVVIIASIWWRDKQAWGWGLMIVGGVLNLIERFLWGGVKDYWQIPLTSIYNNLNDYFIAAGVIQLTWYYIWKKRQ